MAGDWDWGVIPHLGSGSSHQRRIYSSSSRARRSTTPLLHLLLLLLLEGLEWAGPISPLCITPNRNNFRRCLPRGGRCSSSSRARTMLLEQEWEALYLQNWTAAFLLLLSHRHLMQRQSRHIPHAKQTQTHKSTHSAAVHPSWQPAGLLLLLLQLAYRGPGLGQLRETLLVRTKEEEEVQWMLLCRHMTSLPLYCQLGTVPVAIRKQWAGSDQRSRSRPLALAAAVY